VEWATTTQFSTDCYRGVCGAQAAEANEQTVVWMAVVCFVGSALFI
jgi:succinate dehydrogenase/fumarate reductase-like Fe-S protein